jgi:hypothetical protein
MKVGGMYFSWATESFSRRTLMNAVLNLNWTLKFKEKVREDRNVMTIVCWFEKYWGWKWFYDNFCVSFSSDNLLLCEYLSSHLHKNLFQFQSCTSSFQPHYGPGVDLASNRNEYHEYSLGVKGGRRVELTNLPPSMSRLSTNVGTSTSYTLWASTAVTGIPLL